MAELWPGQSCTIVMDNAPYHRQRGVPLLIGVGTKAQMLSVMKQQGMSAMSLPVRGVPKRAARHAKQSAPGAPEAPETYNVELLGEAAVKGGAKASGVLRTTAQDWQVPDLPEMKTAFMSFMKADPGRAELLECKTEKMIKKAGHKLLLTPPYMARVQPIVPLPAPQHPVPAHVAVYRPHAMLNAMFLLLIASGTVC